MGERKSHKEWMAESEAVSRATIATEINKWLAQGFTTEQALEQMGGVMDAGGRLKPSDPRPTMNEADYNKLAPAPKPDPQQLYARIAKAKADGLKVDPKSEAWFQAKNAAQRSGPLEAMRAMVPQGPQPAADDPSDPASIGPRPPRRPLNPNPWAQQVLPQSPGDPGDWADDASTQPPPQAVLQRRRTAMQGQPQQQVDTALIQQLLMAWQKNQGGQ